MTDLKLVFDALTAKRSTYEKLWRYYEGDQPLVYSTERLQAVFSRIDTHFSQNWCAVVIDAILDRLLLERFDVGDNQQVTETLNTLWQQTGMDLDDYDAHLAMLVTGEAFVIVWPDADGAVQAYYNDPRLCHVVYDPENPRNAMFAGKWWVGQEGNLLLTLYYPDRLEYYASRQKSDQVTSAAALKQTDVQPNPYGAIPVFHLRRERRKTLSELANVIPSQDAINKLMSDMMVAAEFGAFRQRYVIANADVGRLKNAPNEIWAVPAGDGIGQATQVGEFSQTELTNYLTAMDKLASAIAAITRTPKHYFVNQGGDPSGEALVAMEAPLNKKATMYAERVTPVWREAAAFLLRVSGVTVERGTITPVFAAVETIQPRMEADITLTNTQAGIPLRVSLSRQGWNDQELAELDAALSEQQQQQRDTLAAAVLRAQRAMDSGQADNGMVQAEGVDNAAA